MLATLRRGGKFDASCGAAAGRLIEPVRRPSMHNLVAGTATASGIMIVLAVSR